MSCQTALALSAMLLVPAVPALAHPHLYVETGVSVVFGPDGTVAVQLDWLYDDFFSILLTADLGIDMDGDTVLTPAETETLIAAVTAWPDNFAGDLTVRQGDTVLPLGPRTGHAVRYDAGRVLETHSRPVTLADPEAPLTIQAYDPVYYVAYDLTGPVRVVGRDDCTATVSPADIDAARTAASALLGGLMPEDIGPDDPFPEIGHTFADTITVTCSAPL